MRSSDSNFDAYFVFHLLKLKQRFFLFLGESLGNHDANCDVMVALFVLVRRQFSDAII